MKIRGVALASFEEQKAGGDPFPIDPNLISVKDYQTVPVLVRFETADLVGKTTRVWLEDGRLMFEAELLNHTDLPKTAAIGYLIESYRSDGTIIKGGPLMSIGLTYPEDNLNHNTPEWEEVE